MRTVITGGKVMDGVSQEPILCDLLIEDGKIKGMQQAGTYEMADQVIDAKGCYVMPGFIDLHVHLRDPGQTAKEDIISGAEAAAKGGVTTICAMPNTTPAVDCVEVLKAIQEKAKDAAVHVLQVSAITKGQDGKELVDMAAMKEAGAVAFSEDGKSVMDVTLCRKAMEQAAVLDMPIMAHCEDKKLVGKGVLNEGCASQRFHVPGISNAVEDIIAARDIQLARDTGARLHLCHCSTAGTVFLVEAAKKMKAKVTAEVCPHHFTLTDADIVTEDTNYKMNPPLRTAADVAQLKAGLQAGIMECISTDHAPHRAEDKAGGFEKAAFGIVGLETSAALTYTELVKKGVLTMAQMVERMSVNPARVIGLEKSKGRICVGYDADLILFDADQEYVISPEEFATKGRNTPFAGKKVQGKVKMTMVAGKVVYQAQQ